MKVPDYSIPVPQNPALHDYMMMYAAAHYTTSPFSTARFRATA